MSDFLTTMKALATQEAKNLRQHATPEELGKLDLDHLDDNSPTRCIYGLMTGHCNSIRAQELILKCCTQVYKTEGLDDNLDAPLNGRPYKVPENKSRHNQYYSPIEILIAPKYGGEEAQKKLVEFLKGDSDILEL